MRRDVFIANDSGGLSVIAVDAMAEIIEDDRSDDYRFVTSFKAMLIELYGDDSMPVRIVVDERLRADEDEQWLARAEWRIDTDDGRLTVMGGFDPDIMASWLEEADGSADGHGVGLIEAGTGLMARLCARRFHERSAGSRRGGFVAAGCCVSAEPRRPAVPAVACAVPRILRWR